ncbi:MAG: Transcriptional regulatory protein AfsQ1 [Betaproteobacteria bacterium ADurb.Bin341]|nr:MAG: Transcriptional regulatory protein AfsQ1 [Betaproteobacteria bacterium ADurb.Bin341]
MQALGTSLPSLKVLVVDDNRTNLHILNVFLNKLGHTVIQAQSGDEALRRFEEESPDLILLDIMMPAPDGFEVARRIRAHQSETWIPIIFLSALDRDENLVEGLDAGGDDYLTKPINFVVLEARMRSMQRSLMLQRHAIESFQRLQAISDSVMEAIITIDAEGRIVSANAATQNIFGWACNDLIGKDIAALIPESHRGTHQYNLNAYMARQTPQTSGHEREIEALRRDGTAFSAELGISEIRLEGKHLLIGVVRDVTERKRAERKLQENARQLQSYYDATQAEQNLAMALMQQQLHRRGLQDPQLRYTVIPAARFSGDIVAAGRSENGCFYALLADATGHGLAAAISVLPILTVFYRMTGLGHTISEIVLELNQQLRESVPVGRFVAASLVCLDENKRTGEIWMGGTPNALLIGHKGRIEQSFASIHLPLGILASEEAESAPISFRWNSGDQLLLCSDGLLDAENPGGQPFTPSGLKAAVAQTHPESRFDAILGALARHLDGQAAEDDVSIMLIDCP